MNYNSNCELKVLGLFTQLNKHVPFLNKCCVMIAVCVVFFILPAGCSHEPDSVTSSMVPPCALNQPLESHLTSVENPTDVKQRKAGTYDRAKRIASRGGTGH